MFNQKVLLPLNSLRWFTILTVCGLGAVTLQCCGSVTQGENRLSVSLLLPEGEDASLFWFGVAQKSLRLSPAKGDPSVFAWGEGKSNEIDVREGDKVEFFGADDKGRLLVTGETTVGGEKKATIPLRRVL